jgi:toxin ParE1/3/4
MSRPVIVLDEAEAELREAEAWYEAQRHGLGSEFLVAIGEAMDRLTSWPQLAPLIAAEDALLPTARSIFVNRFPYSIVFIETDETRWIIAFAHQRKRPGYWGRRRSASSE